MTRPDGQLANSDSAPSRFSWLWGEEVSMFTYLAVGAAITLAVVQTLTALLESRKLFTGDEINVLKYAWYFNLAGLLGAWCGLSNSRWSWRVLAFVVGTAVLGVITIVLLREDEELVFLAVAQVCIQTIFCAILRRRGLSLLRTVGNECRVGLVPAARLERAQLSIRDLLLWVAGFAVLFAVVQRFRFDFSWILRDFWPLVAYVTAFALLGVGALWATLGTRHWTLRLAVLVLLVACLAEFCDRVTRPPPDRSWWFVFIGAQAACTVFEMWVLKIQGFRLVRTPVPRPGEK